ncbi:MAG TPA: hypothetical protein VLB84_02510 [Bacteroidia bacterium]|nr:hypothetical protein [Bacteroidia bacterium]
MNRYQQEVAEMDRRHRLRVRGVSFTAAAVLAIAALWSAGLPLTGVHVKITIINNEQINSKPF